ncbi:5743_t:CDS:1 [Dentiscutata heterogama]|uniref:5743_t:CDS:1 n=1 Tax=Dentiscutata heterogama TaxID=1316150 RepID=A0ACA9LLL2_9GLOM|nr:5743_t:CDS:1 [Dentiscutata heterogama]
MSVGKMLAEKLQYRFINSELFYRYLEYYFDDNISVSELIKNLENLKKNYKLILTIEQLDEQDYNYSGERASELSKNNELRKAINSTIKNITKKKGYVITRHDTTTNILPHTELKIVLLAEFET